jgi:hypothetical protein
MLFKLLLLVMLATGFTLSATAQKPFSYLPIRVSNDKLIESLMKIKSEEFKKVLATPNKYEIQIIYTQINHREGGQQELIQHRYRLNNKQYFYPASLVKLPVSALALEKCNLLGISSSDYMITLSDHTCQQEVRIDSSAADYKPSVGHYVKKMMLVSDNDAYSRIYEFLGADAIKQKTTALEMKETDIIQRFDAACTPADNLFFNPIVFLNEKGDTVYKQAGGSSSFYSNHRYIKKTKGKAYRNARGKLIKKPKDFTRYNTMPLQEINDFLIALMYPELVPENKRLNLKPSDYNLLLTGMSSYPRESIYPPYDGKKYEDSYKKYLLLADYHDTIKTDSLRIFNVVGQSYGWLSDCAYFIDYKNKIDFFLSAVIYVNANQILNDGRYEYKSIGFPFLSDLGKLIYEYDRNRKRESYGKFERFEKLHQKP